MPDDEGQQALWNVDGAQLYVIFTIKTEASIALSTWDLETAYWKLRNLRREVDAKLRRDKKEDYKFQRVKRINGKDMIEEDTKKMSEKEAVDYLLDMLGEERVAFLQSPQSDAELSRFYLALEEFYIFLSRLMKQHGLWLREGEDAMDAFRRR